MRFCYGEAAALRRWAHLPRFLLSGLFLDFAETLFTKHALVTVGQWLKFHFPRTENENSVFASRLFDEIRRQREEAALPLS
jgi:hypothetical protein